ARPPRRHDRLLRLHDQRRRERGDRRRMWPAGRSDRLRVAAVRASAPARVPADPAARPWNERLLRRAAHNGDVIWRDFEIEPSIYAADFARLGEQVETLLDAGVRVFHFDVGD